MNEGARHVCRLDMTEQDVFMNPFGAFFEVQVPFYTRHVKKGEKGKHFSYPDYFTSYLVSHYGRLGQRCPDNRGCTVVDKLTQQLLDSAILHCLLCTLVKTDRFHDLLCIDLGWCPTTLQVIEQQLLNMEKND